jgi:hypothetical protein
MIEQPIKVMPKVEEDKIIESDNLVITQEAKVLVENL